MLRSGESFLSANWLEYFHSSERQIQMSGVRQALRDKGFRIRFNGRFAVLNVGYSIGQVRGIDLDFRLLGEVSDPSHTGIFGYDFGDTDTAIVLAKSVREVHPAAE